VAVEISGLCKAFNEHQVLKSLELRLEDDGIYCLMAPSGTGKTTLLRIILGLETKDAGTICGINPGEVSAMFQENRLCEALTPVENVALACPGKVSRSAIRRNLELILPTACMEQPTSELSGGMKRRVALARAMNYPGRMILLDEPFTGLDMDTKKRVIAYILGMRNQRILLVATHGEEDAAWLGAKKIRLGDG